MRLYAWQFPLWTPMGEHPWHNHKLLVSMKFSFWLGRQGHWPREQGLLRATHKDWKTLALSHETAARAVWPPLGRSGRGPDKGREQGGAEG